jgi:oligopeptide transport system ATP-binding protein
MNPVLDIRNLKVTFTTQDGDVLAVKGANFHVNAGETIAIVGESGSGKSQSMMAAMGLLARNGKATGEVFYRGQNILGLAKEALNQVRGCKITMIFQEPMTSLDPLYTIGNQLIEPIVHHQKLSPDAARSKALAMLQLVKIPDAERRMNSYPHELSGGQRQRVMIAMALANSPDVLIADEPTTALDVTIQAEILELMAELQRTLGMAMVFITHDLNIVRRIANRVYVMRNGDVVEECRDKAEFSKPKHEYTRALTAAEPTGRKLSVPANLPPILEGNDMRVTYNLGGGFSGSGSVQLKAVDGVSIVLRPGQTIGIVGESGSGKSTLARALLRLVHSQGEVIFDGRKISNLDKKAMRPLRREIQIIFQDPFGSLSPRMTAGEIVTEGLLVHETQLTTLERDIRAIRAFEEVQLDPNLRNRYPHEFSGGQRQRIAIARAIILNPKVLVLDEPTSALDRQVQKQIIELLRNLQAQHNLSYLFISHDLAVIRALADFIMVMKDGKLVEQGTTDEIMLSPHNPYTQKLIAAALG